MEIENATGKLKIVFDTNIFVSSLNKWRGNPYKAYRKLLDGAFIHYTSLEILREITRVLREDFDWPVDCIVFGDSHLLALGEYCGVKIVPVGEFLKLIE